MDLLPFDPDGLFLLSFAVLFGIEFDKHLASGIVTLPCFTILSGMVLNLVPAFLLLAFALIRLHIESGHQLPHQRREAVPVGAVRVELAVGAQVGNRQVGPQRVVSDVFGNRALEGAVSVAAVVQHIHDDLLERGVLIFETLFPEVVDVEHGDQLGLMVRMLW